MERCLRWNLLQRSLGSVTSIAEETCMSRHNKTPPVPPANRSPRERGEAPEAKAGAAKNTTETNTAEQGESANVRQNTTNAGYFKGRRMK